MKRSAVVALALAGGAIATGALADTRAYVTVQGAPPVYVQNAPPVYVQEYRRNGPPLYAYESGEYDMHRHHRECRAARWDPNARYMPGQEVWRNGQLYRATEVSRNVYNVNSPPEWTPNYWRPMHHCD